MSMGFIPPPEADRALPVTSLIAALAAVAAVGFGVGMWSVAMGWIAAGIGLAVVAAATAAEWVRSRMRAGQ